MIADYREKKLRDIDCWDPHGCERAHRIHCISAFSREIMTETTALLVLPSADFTANDRAYAEAYVANRALLYQLWDLATVYPNVASKIRVSVRRADPRADYAYEPSFADSAIVVNLSWFDERVACDFLSCNPLYPRGKTCRYGDAPRIFPSGDVTTLTACEPACYMMRAAARDNDASRYYDARDGCEVMLKDGSYRREMMVEVTAPHRSVSIRRDDESTAKSAINFTGDAPPSVVDANAPDMPLTEFSVSTGRCELGNLGLTAFVSQPYYRSATHDVCRQDNFVIGDDMVLAKAGDEYETAGRHSRSYCNAFYKEFNEKTRECESKTWESVLSYTFLGSAFVRLGRHAIYGDGCGADNLFAADENRAETVADMVPFERRDKGAWFASVDRGWCLPPPNVLLSDLGITRDDQVWINRDGGRIETRSNFRRLDDSDGKNDDDDDDENCDKYDPRAIARRRVQRTSDHDSSFVLSRLTKTESASGLDFTEIYDEIARKTSSEAFVETAERLAKEVGSVAASVITEDLLRRVTRTAFNKALRYMGQRFAGDLSSVLTAAGVRVAASRMISTTLSRLSTRLMLALATTASGVGTVLGVIELISLLLDVLIMTGWDPGNYNVEFDNAVYDDMARAWREQKKMQMTARVDPYLVLNMFASRDDARFASSGDDSVRQTPRRNERTHVTDKSSVPWYFAPFGEATSALIRDECEDDTGSGDTDPSARARPVSSDHPVVCSILWSMHYFRHRSSNSIGQRIDHTDCIKIDEEFVSRGVRDNEMSSLLATSASGKVRRSLLLGAARRNVVDGAAFAFRAVSIIAIGIVGTGLAAILDLAMTKSGARDCTRLVVALAIAIVVGLAIVAAHGASELLLPAARSYERDDENADRDPVDELCDAITRSLSTLDESPYASLIAPFRQELRVIVGRD